MRFRLGAFAGFALGYYLGAKAGRERYFEINRTARRVRESGTFRAATGKAREVIDLTVDRARDAAAHVVEDRRSPPEPVPDEWSVSGVNGG